jgi:hypothetical protein
MKSGKLREAIAIQRATTTINDAGTPADTWAIIARLRAEKVEQSTAEAIRAFGARHGGLRALLRRAWRSARTAQRSLCRPKTRPAMARTIGIEHGAQSRPLPEGKELPGPPRQTPLAVS